jgi:hypothetical protein
MNDLAQTVPKRRAALLVGTAAQFGDELVAKQLREFGDEQQPPQRQQSTVVAIALIGAQEQRAEFRLASHFVIQD